MKAGGPEERALNKGDGKGGRPAEPKQAPKPMPSIVYSVIISSKWKYGAPQRNFSQCRKAIGAFWNCGTQPSSENCTPPGNGYNWLQLTLELPVFAKMTAATSAQ